MQCEARECTERDEDDNIDSHPFIAEGLEPDLDQERPAPQTATSTGARTHFQHGKTFCQELKDKLFA